MPKQLTVNIASQPEGHPIEVPGLGIVENGSTVEVPDDRLVQFENTTGLTLEDGEVIQTEQPSEGPTLHTGPPPATVVLEDAPRDEAGLTLNQLADPNATAQPRSTEEPTAEQANAPQVTTEGDDS